MAILFRSYKIKHLLTSMYFSKTLHTSLLIYVINFTQPQFCSFVNATCKTTRHICCDKIACKLTFQPVWCDSSKNCNLNFIWRDNAGRHFHFLPVHTMMTQACGTKINQHHSIFISRVLCKAGIGFSLKRIDLIYNPLPHALW